MSATTPATISVVIPAYQAADHLAAAIRSILDQTLPATEVIVVDDGSSDATAAVAGAFGAPVTVVRQRNAGAPAARNAGVARATGDYLGFLDADDRWTPDKLARQVGRLRDAPDAVCVGQFQGYDLLDRPVGAPTLAYTSSTLLTARATFDRIGGFNPALRHAEALEWFLRARAIGVAEIALAEVIVLRRLRPDSLSHADPRASQLEHLRVLRHFRSDGAATTA